MKRTVLSPKDVGEALSRSRRKAELTQEELSQQTGINTSSISRYEQGKDRIGTVNLKKLCTALGCSPKDFLTYAWGISQEEIGGARPVAKAEFPAAELEQIYDEFASLGKVLFMKTCRVVFDTSQDTIAPPPHGNGPESPPKDS